MAILDEKGNALRTSTLSGSVKNYDEAD